MAIEFTCQCGKAFRVADESAGKRAKCPNCGAIMSVPTPVVDAELATPQSPAAAVANDGQDHTTSSPQGSQWWMRSDGKSLGPFTPQELEQKVLAGVVHPATPVRQGPDGQWVRADSVRGLIQPVQGVLGDPPARMQTASPSRLPTGLPIGQPVPSTPATPKSQGSNKSSEQPDLGEAVKNLWAAAKAKAKDLGGKVTQAARNPQAKSQEQTLAQAGFSKPVPPIQTSAGRHRPEADATTPQRPPNTKPILQVTISPWSPPSRQDFEDDATDACQKILLRCEEIQKYAQEDQATLEVLEEACEQFQVVGSTWKEFLKHRQQMRQRQAIEDESVRIVAREGEYLRQQIVKAKRQKNDQEVDALQKRLRELTDAVNTEELRARMERAKQEKDQGELQLKYQTLIATIVDDIAERILRRRQEQAKQKREAISEALEKAGKDIFGGLKNANTESFGDWYSRFFSGIIQLPLMVSLPIQAAIWFFGGVVLIPCIYLYGRVCACPACGQLFAREVANREVLVASDGVQTVIQQDRHYARDGTSTGYTNREQQVQVRRQLVQLHYRCKFCQHTWEASQMEVWQK